VSQHPTDASTGDLVGRLSEDVSRLVRDELRLAQTEMTQKAKGVGIGAGLFGAAGILAGYGGGALVATAILALALVMDAWLAALIVTVVLFSAAGVAALLGKNKVTDAGPPVPTRTIDNVKQDADALRPGHGAGQEAP